MMNATGANRVRVALRCAALLVGAPALSAADDASWTEPLLRVTSGEYRQLVAGRERFGVELASLPRMPGNQQSGRLGYQVYRYSLSPISFSAWVEIELPEETEMDAVVLVPVDAPFREFPGPGYGFPARFRVEVRGGAEEHTIANHVARSFPNPGGLPVWIPSPGVRGRRVRVTMTEPWHHGDHPFYVFALGEVMVMRGNRNLAAGAPVTASEVFESLNVWGKANLTDGQSVLGAPLTAERSPTLGYHSTIVDSADVMKWVQVDLGTPTRIDEVRLIGAYVVQFPGRPGFGFPVRFKIETADEPTFVRPVMLADETADDFPNPASNPVVVSARDLSARYVRITATKLWERAENFAFALAEMQIYSGDRNVALDRAVDCLDKYPSVSGAWLPKNLTDGFASEHRLTEWPAWLRGLSRRREALAELAIAERQAASVRAGAVNRLTTAAWLTGMVGAVGLFITVFRARRSRERELQRLRERIAADLHDEIGSNLASIALLSDMGLRRKGGMVQTDLEEIRRVARLTAESMRDIVELIQRPATTGEDFVGRLREIAGRMLTGLEWTFEVNARPEPLSIAAQRQLLLVLKEALHNVRKHAAARHVAIELGHLGAQLQLRIADDGAGFDPATITDGHGLANLRHRAAALGGKLEIASRPGSGTTLTFRARLDALRASDSP